MDGETRIVPLAFGVNAWTFDLDRLFDQVDDKPTATLIHSPSNPTGWVMDRDSQQAVPDVCRQRGVLLISDEIYRRLVYDQPLAPLLD
jgi:aspartate/methionine/tyrosine aminotransferase